MTEPLHHRYSNLEKVAEELRITKRYILDAARSGQLQAFKVGAAWIAENKDIEKWLKAHQKND